jgi:hypothetical protein
MGWKNLADRKAWEIRRSRHMAQQGVLMEAHVENILNTMKEAGIVLDFTHHAKCSPADRSGKDFTVSKVVNGDVVAVSFGITISQKSMQRACLLHDEVPQLWFPLGIKPETIQRKIMGLFLQVAAVRA